jgi:hypothetical protein
MEHFGAQRIDANYPIARRLVEAYPEKAIELIATTIDYDEINKHFAVASHSKSNSAPIVNARNACSALERPYAPASSTSSQHSASPKSPPITPRFNRFRGNQSVVPPSPPSTSSTGRSSNRPEYINVPVGATKEQKLSIRKVSIEHSVICQSIVDRLGDIANIEPIQDGSLHTPYQDAPNGFLISYHQIELTWRRDDSHKTHMTTFYIVEDIIDADILLGEADSGEGLTTSSYFNLPCDTRYQSY